jgi:hypothetical protein
MKLNMDEKDIGDVVIGSVKIHSNQVNAGESVSTKLLDGPTHLTAGCQSGKTGVVIYAVNRFLNTGFDIDMSKLLRDRDMYEDFNEKMKKTQVIWMNARSDNHLRKQTEDRLMEAFGKNKVMTKDSISQRRTLSNNDKEKKGKLIGKVYIGHLSDVQIDSNNTLVQLKKVIDINEPLLLIVDESHVAQDAYTKKSKVDKDGKITMVNLGVLDNFCKNLGIYLTQPKDKWEPRRYFLSMSATRPSWSVYINDFKNNFGNNYIPNIVHLHPGDNYCGIAKDFDNVTIERFVQLEPFYNKMTKSVSSQIIKEVRTLNNGKCVLIRCSLDQSDYMISSLKKLGFTEDCGYVYSKCGHNKQHSDADSLNDYFKDCTIMKDDKAVIFIENFLGAGATFPNVRIHANFVRFNKTGNPASHIQSVGRSFGYSDEYTDENGNIKVFNKKDAKYKIYCDLETMELYKKGFDTDLVPVYNDAATVKHKRNTDEYNWHLKIVSKVEGESKGTTIQNYFKNLFIGKKDFDVFFDTYSVRMAYTKTTNYLDICKLINTQKYTDKDEKQSIIGKIICIDGANSYHDDNKNQFIGHLNSHDELMDNIRNNQSWLCKYGITLETFKNNYVCIYVSKDKTVKNNIKLKKDTVLSI